MHSKKIILLLKLKMIGITSFQHGYFIVIYLNEGQLNL